MLTDAGVLSGALILSILHAVIPNHWAPFVVVGNLRGWSRPKLALVTLGAGFLHSIITLGIGLAVAYAGFSVQRLESHSIESVAATILILMGMTLIAGRALGRHLHQHFDPKKFSAATTDAILISALVGMLSLSPCAEILPLYLLAAAGSWKLVVLLSVVVVTATTIGMTAIVLFFGDRISHMRWKSIEENEGLLAGILLLLLGIFAALRVDEGFFPTLQSMSHLGAATLKGSWGIFRDAAAYILFGCLMGGLVYAFVRPERVARLLGRGKFKPVVTAALIGVPLPLCSCGVIPAALTLRRMGATRGATTAFLITTPETGVDSIAVTYALLDPIYTVFRPIAAFFTGVTAGVLEVLFGVGEDSPAGKRAKQEEDACEHCTPTAAPATQEPVAQTLFQKFKTAFTYGLGDFLDDISGWLLIGFLVAGLILAVIPPEAIERTMGGGITGMLIVLVVSVPLYICASATTPMAAALLLKGASPGAALVLLLAGPATNTAGLILLSKFLGKRSVIIYLSSIVICSLGFGLLLNQIYVWMGTSPVAAIGAHHAEPAGHFKTVCALILAGLVAFHLLRQATRYFSPRASA